MEGEERVNFVNCACVILLPHSRNMHVRLNEDSKSPIGVNVTRNGCLTVVWLACNQSRLYTAPPPKSAGKTSTSLATLMRTSEVENRCMDIPSQELTKTVMGYWLNLLITTACVRVCVASQPLTPCKRVCICFDKIS